MSDLAVRDWVRACHPEPCAAVTVFATALAWDAGRGIGAVWVAVAVLAGQLSVGWGNDWVDRARDRRAGRADKPVANGRLDPAAVRRAWLVALGLCVVFSLPSGGAATAVHLTAVGLGWSYNLGLKATAASVVPYAAAFGLLPVFVALGPPLYAMPAAWTIVTGALLGVAAHFANTLPDAAADARTGVRGLPQRLGPTYALAGAVIAVLAASAVVAAGSSEPLGLVGRAGAGLAALMAVAASLAWWRGAPRAAFLLIVAAAGCVVVQFLAGGPLVA